MSKYTAPAVEVSDARSWELTGLPPCVRYQYTLHAVPGQTLCTVQVAIVWEPVVGVVFVLAHEGETAQSPRIQHVSGAWIRACARLNGRVSRETLPELIKAARWNLDAKLPIIRA